MSNVKFLGQFSGATNQLGDVNIVTIDKARETFGRSEAEPVIVELRDVAADAFGVEVELKSIDGIRDHVMNVNSCFLAHDGRNLLGFASVRIFSEFDLCYLHGVAVRNRDQQKGIGIQLLNALINHNPRSILAFTTQNPVMYDD